jgi:magnesium-transporting ATPase (P-type)
MAHGAERWHDREAEAVLAALETGARGLGAAEAERRLERHGANRLPEPPRPSPLARLAGQFNNVLIYVLLAAAAITTALGHLTDAGVILAVVLVNAVIGFVQEGRAERAMEAIRGMLAPEAAVMRDGARRSVPAEALVPGDVVLLEAGDRVPADLRLIRARGLRADEAMLTGESVPVDKQVAPAVADAALGDRTSMAFSGTLVTGGQGAGVVVATGAATEIGRISGLLAGVEALQTPLLTQMDVFARWLTLLILMVSALLLAFGVFVAHYDFSEIFMVVVGLAVAAIPEGLPAVLTITLAIGVQAMARRNAIVRRLPAIETLGAVSVICTDKTGTLTRNEMAAASVLTAAHRFALEGEGYAPRGAVRLGGTAVAAGEHAVLEELARAALLCNDAALHERGGAWAVEGDPMEGALLALAGRLGLDPGDAGGWRRTDAIPFDARHRFMATMHHAGDGDGVVYVKGAPERILAMCAHERTAEGGTAPLPAAAWRERAEAVAAEGQRLLAFGMRPAGPAQADLGHEHVEGGLTLIGMVGLIDPPRPEAVAAVADCRRAGIRVKMITGDHAGTAAAIGRQVGLENPDRVLTGADLDGMDDAALRAAVLDADVFARTSPEHKLRLVTALQAHGLTVAMTGDGVNDAPALKRADAGVAMGRKGSAAAKEAADLVLADDNFASIAAAVREGRTVYDNIRKVISWTLPTNAGEATTIIAALLAGMTLPITAVQILWVNLVTAATLGLALAFEPTEADTMRRPPRARDAPLLTGSLVWTIVLTSVLFLCGIFGVFAYALDRGHSLALTRTLAVNTLVVMEIFYLFYIRNMYGTSLTWEAVWGTKPVWLTVGVVTIAQFAFTYLPPMQRVFGTEPVPFADGVLVVGVGAALLAVIEVEKQLRLRLAAMRTG